MSKRKKKIEFIRQNRHLPTGELAAQTGFDERQVAEILGQLNAEEKVAPSSSNPAMPDKRVFWSCILFLVLAVVLFYLPVLNNGFVGWDDEDTIVNNVHIRSLDLNSLKWMLTTFQFNDWMPLTWFSLALDFGIGGLNPKIYHFTNLLLHSFNTILVFLVCLRILSVATNLRENFGESRTKTIAVPAAVIAAIFFGLHPIHVESVAWATERKDVLYSFFYLLGIFLYLDYATSNRRRILKLSACLGLFLLSLMSKGMAVTLPLVFLILDGWPLRRLQKSPSKVLIEKIPFFVLALVFGLLTLVSHAKAISSTEASATAFWTMNAFRSLVFYPLKMAVPLNLVPLYPFPRLVDNLYKLENLIAALLVILVTVACIRFWRKVPYLGAAWFYYLITLFPALGFVKVGVFAAADRYTYLPSVSLFMLFSTGAAYWLWRRRALLWGFTAVLIAVLGYGTVKQIGIWKDTQTLWESVVKVYPDQSSTAHTNLGVIYTEIGRIDDALREFNRALAIPPPLATTYNGIGNALMFKGRVEEAIQAFKSAVALKPGDNLPRQNLWRIYEHLGRHEDAAAQMQEAIKMEPEATTNYVNLGVSYSFLKRYPEAQAAFQKAYDLEPGKTLNRVNLATIFVWQKKLDEALEIYRKGVESNPREPIFYVNMADIYLDKKIPGQALELLGTAMNLNPADPKIVQQIGEDYERAGRKDLARQCYERAKVLTAATRTR